MRIGAPGRESRLESRSYPAVPQFGRSAFQARSWECRPGATAHRGKNAYTGWISRFMSATASTSPVKSARAMIEWPMFSSRTPSIAATALTLW